jgi:hypothetical protein
VTTVAVEAGLRAVAAPFAGDEPAGSVALRWGPLFAALDSAGDEGFIEAVELIYEGYLVHYRSGRLAAIASEDRPTALLAGDVFYARGLRMIAARGDVASVRLLTRLMSACSCLRSLGASFAADDALWAYTMAALAAVRAGVPPAAAAAFFDEIDAELGAGAPAEVPRRAAAAAAALGLPDPAPLDAAFAPLLRADAPAASQPAEASLASESSIRPAQ